MKPPRITAVRPLTDFRVELTFSGGVRATLDLRGDILGHGGVFAEIEDPEFFRLVRVDADAGTIAWPNGVDLCPDVLYRRATGQPVPYKPSSLSRSACAYS
jgi:hypothetical protein